jgi:formiminoglutamate deiminase
MAATPASLWFDTALLPDGWARQVRVRVAGGRIGAVETGVIAAPDDERHDIGIPGLCNLHSHAFQRAIAGLTEISGATADDFWTWREVMYRFVDRMAPDDLEAVTAFAFAEMLQSGFTRVGEFHYLHHGPDGAPYQHLAELCLRVASAAETAGIGLTLLPVFYGHGGFGGAPTSAGQRRFLNDLDRFTRLHEQAGDAIKPLDGARLGVAPHSLRAVTPQELTAIAALALDGPIHIHAAEQVREVEDCLAWSGQRPIEWLLDNADVDERWCIVHATHMTEAETARLAASQAVAGLCPITEANLGDGVFPAKAYVEAGGRYGVGSDSNVQIDLAGELRMLEYSQRLRRRSRNVLAVGPNSATGARLFADAWRGGAQALGVRSAGIAVGGPLDLVSLDAKHPSLFWRTADALLDGWVFAGGAGVIDCVWRDGRKIVEQGRHIRMEPIQAAYRRTLARLLAQ